MIYFFYGTNQDVLRKQLHTVLNSLRAKKPDAAYFYIDSENAPDVSWEELVAGQGLFTQKYLVFCNAISDTIQNDLKTLAPAMAQSENIFLVLEGSLNKKEKGLWEKYAAKVIEKEDTAQKKIKEFNIFALTDALARRDAKNAWVIYQRALREGKVVEEMHGLCIWQVKTIVQAQRSSSAQEAGLKPFVYTKAKKARYTQEESKDLYKRMVDLYHNARRGNVDFETGLEQLILSL